MKHSNGDIQFDPDLSPIRQDLDQKDIGLPHDHNDQREFLVKNFDNGSETHSITRHNFKVRDGRKISEVIEQQKTLKQLELDQK